MRQTTHHKSKKPKVPPVKDVARLEGKVVDPLDLAGDDLRSELDALSRNESEYTSELQYSGYSDVEDYDNNAYDLNIEKEKQLDPEQELNFDDRKPDPHSEEEDPIHPQS